MRICVVSDVHSNLPALDAVLEAAAPYDAVWHLGDIVGYGPQPNEVVERLAAEGALGVRGNHDAAAIGALSSEPFNVEARQAIDWTAGQLGAHARAWLSGLVERRETGDFTLVHGSPRDPSWEYVFSTGAARGSLNAVTTAHCLVGHTHVPMAFLLDGQRLETIKSDGTAIAIGDQRTLLNPGSVGQPRDGDSRASAMVIDTDTRRVNWLRVPYDIGLVQQLMIKADLPPRLVHRLALGI
jgi:predicted phosphodiesterase